MRSHLHTPRRAPAGPRAGRVALLGACLAALSLAAPAAAGGAPAPRRQRPPTSSWVHQPRLGHLAVVPEEDSEVHEILEEALEESFVDVDSGADGPAAPQDAALAAQLERIRRRGAWGSVLDLHGLGLLAEVRVAVCLPDADDARVCDAIAHYGAAAATKTVVLANDRDSTHWWAFVPDAAHAASVGAPPPRRLVGTRVDTGGEGDCMYYAFMHALAPQLAPARQGLDALERRLARDNMLHLRRRLYDWLAGHWQMSLAEAGGADGAGPSGELYRLEMTPEPQEGLSHRGPNW